jgi:zinc transport system permease protein
MRLVGVGVFVMQRYFPLLAVLGVAGLFIADFHFGLGQQAGNWLDERVRDVADWSRETQGLESPLSHSWLITGLLGGALASLICGVISSLVVSNRMAFFSDALAHCAFAGVSLGLILFLAGVLTSDAGILGVTIVFGMLVGALIAFVRETTPLASDTVIGVFFAGAMGLGVVLLKGVRNFGVGGTFDPDTFLFGDLLTVTGRDVIHLLVLVLVMTALLCWIYNRLVFASFSPSLARSRNFPVRLGNYLFIILLALIVNVCLKIVGVLLINALLVIPGATAAILARNLRQFFWYSVGLAFVAGLGGLAVGVNLTFKYQGKSYSPASSGTIVILGVLLFFLAMLVSRFVRGPRPAARTSF